VLHGDEVPEDEPEHHVLAVEVHQRLEQRQGDDAELKRNGIPMLGTLRDTITSRCVMLSRVARWYILKTKI
jgi:hypothetical protein